MEIETLLDLYKAGGTLNVRCLFDGREGMKTVRACQWREALDLRTLMWTRGRRLPVSALTTKLRCPECGSRRVAIAMVLPGGAGALRAAI